MDPTDRATPLADAAPHVLCLRARDDSRGGRGAISGPTSNGLTLRRRTGGLLSHRHHLRHSPQALRPRHRGRLITLRCRPLVPTWGPRRVVRGHCHHQPGDVLLNTPPRHWAQCVDWRHRTSHPAHFGATRPRCGRDRCRFRRGVSRAQRHLPPTRYVVAGLLPRHSLAGGISLVLLVDHDEPALGTG